MQTYIHQPVPMKDGVHLATDVYTPDGPGPFPTVLIRTPYHRAKAAGNGPLFTSRGYGVVIQDCRGKYDSDGVFNPLADETEDGQVTLDWVANQRWCNGRIGLWGRSYLGIVQVPTASGGHEALRCILPSVAPGSFFRDWIRYDGCFALANTIRWALTHASCRNQPSIAHFSWQNLNHLPNLQEMIQHVGFDTPCLKDWSDHDQYDTYWEHIDQDRMHAHIRVPGLHAGGWFDHLTRGQFNAYRNIRDQGGTEAARSGQRLLIGPWGHNTVSKPGPDHQQYGDWHFGPEANLSVMAHEFQCLDFYLKDIDNGYAQQAPVKVFLMGDNRWVDLDDWPPQVDMQSWCLDSDGSANKWRGNGALKREAPDRSVEDVFTYDPTNPVPTLGGAIYWGLDQWGPVDQRPILDRTDVLYYRSDPLPNPISIIGDINLDLTIASDSVDTDFVAKLCVAEVSGAVTCLTVGSLRCRYRQSWSQPQPLTPGESSSITLRLGHMAYTFPAGSRISLLITSSDFPRIAPHSNTMAAPWAYDEIITARNTVRHGPGAPSCLHLPVMAW